MVRLSLQYPSVKLRTTRIGTPRPIRLRRPRGTAGLLARRSMHDADLPGFPVVTIGNILAAYSCGGSRSFEFCALTAFPFNPDREPSAVEFIR